MARMYSRKKGKSGSTKPSKKAVPSWVTYKAKEVELLVAKLAKEGKTTSEVGLILRDNYGIPCVKILTGKSISAILKTKNLLKDIPDDLMSLIKKSIEIRSHLEENKKDMTAKRGLLLTESKIRRLVKYYKNNKRLSNEWKYDPKKIKLMLE